MIRQTRILFLFTILFWSFLSGDLNAQFSLGISAGNSSPLHELTKKELGLNNVIGQLNYVPGKIGLGLQVNINKYETNQDFLNQFNEFSTSFNSSRQDWNSNFIFLGPVFKIGKGKLNVEIFPKIGLGFIDSPDRELSYNIGSENYILYADNQVDGLNGTNLFSGLDAKLNFSITDKIGFHLFSGINTNQLFGSGNSTTYREVNLSGNGVTEEELSNGRLLQLNCNAYHLLNVGAGININLSKKTNGGKDEKPTERLGECFPTMLQAPNTNESYALESERRPDFQWTNYDSRVKHYLFDLSKGGRSVYNKKLSGNQLKHSNELEKIYRKGTGEEDFYSWKITTVYKDCPSKISEDRIFVIRDGGGSYIDVFDIVCEDPAYDGNGNVRYTAKVTLRNDAQSIGPWQVNNLTLNPGGTVISATSFRSCGSPSFSPFGPYQIPPGGTQTWCIDFSVPFGTVNLSSTANGTMNGGVSTVSDQDTLPSCICDECDSWQFVQGNSSLVHIPTLSNQGHPVNFQIYERLQILGSSPIMEVKAEIVYIQHEVNDTLCYTCTKQENHMGLFSFRTLKPRLFGTSGLWQNQPNAFKGKDDNNDEFSNQAIWKVNNPTVGENFALARNFVLPINLPKQTSLDCCNNKFKVCVRYTFTDINCKTCDFLSCYEYDGSTTTGSGGIGTGPGGIGNQQGTGGIGSQQGTGGVISN